jgi:hypothetical protein
MSVSYARPNFTTMQVSTLNAIRTDLTNIYFSVDIDKTSTPSKDIIETKFLSIQIGTLKQKGLYDNVFIPDKHGSVIQIFFIEKQKYFLFENMLGN